MLMRSYTDRRSREINSDSCIVSRVLIVIDFVWEDQVLKSRVSYIVEWVFYAKVILSHA